MPKINSKKSSLAFECTQPANSIQIMGAPEDADVSGRRRQPPQAILLADSFATRFYPITLERPKVLLPLVNKPMIDYTLSWLESEGVREVFVFCCAHSHQVIEYLENSEWLSRPNFTVTTVESHNSTSAGDALRLIYERDVIHGDFVLISGDTVTNMSLTNAFQEHKERRKKDNDAVMTMVIKQSKPSPVTHQSRLGADELFMAIDPQTNQLLYYEGEEQFKQNISLDNSLLADNPSVSLHNDKQDCYIDICSQEVLSLFKDNFDYQHLRRHFVKGLLVDDIMGYKIFTHEIHSSYAARIDSYRSYDTVSKDIIQRWTYPYVPDVNFSGNYSAKLGKEGMYHASEIEQSRSAQIGPFTFIGKGTSIGSNSKISNSCIGEGCKIGSGVSIVGSYIWDNVTIGDGCELKHAIVCNGVVIKSKAVLEPGVVLSFKVVVGEKFVVPAYSKVSLLQEPTMEDSDEELEYADNSSGSGDASELGEDGIGYIWSIGEGNRDEEWRHSVAPIPADKLPELGEAIEDSLELLHLDSGSLPPSGELKSDEDINYSDDFEKEVEATFLKAVDENDDVKNVVLEMSALRLSCEGRSAADCGRAIFYSMMKLAVETSRSNKDQFPSILSSVIDKWRKLLQHFDFAKDIDEQIELILKLEEMCLESLKELSPLFEGILHVLYRKDIISEDAILEWDDMKEDAKESDRVFVKQSQGLIKWLKVAEEEEEEED